ncbi:MAG: hypothetical protein ABL888_04720 [Pirellulaceae bacterium]
MSLKKSIIDDVRARYPGIGNNDPLASNDFQKPKRTLLMSDLNDKYGKWGQNRPMWKALPSSDSTIKNSIAEILAYEHAAIDYVPQTLAALESSVEHRSSAVSGAVRRGGAMRAMAKKKAPKRMAKRMAAKKKKATKPKAAKLKVSKKKTTKPKAGTKKAAKKQAKRKATKKR